MRSRADCTAVRGRCYASPPGGRDGKGDQQRKKASGSCECPARGNQQQHAEAPIPASLSEFALRNATSNETIEVMSRVPPALEAILFTKIATCLRMLAAKNPLGERLSIPINIALCSLIATSLPLSLQCQPCPR